VGRSSGGFLIPHEDDVLEERQTLDRQSLARHRLLDAGGGAGEDLDEVRVFHALRHEQRRRVGLLEHVL
jgi:hypothetical protein